VLPPWITDPLWDQFHALLPERIDQHPLGCHRPRIGDRIVFDKLLQALVFGCGYQRVADHTCSERTLRRRRDEWIAAGVAEQLHRLAVAAYDRLIGLELDHLAVDGCITKAPCGGEVAGPSPVDRGKGGSKRSLVVEGHGIPLGVVVAAANRRDDGLLAVTLDTLDAVGSLPERPTVHLDAGYDYRPLLPGACSPWSGRPGRHPWGACVCPGGPQVGGGTLACLVERVRQVALLHRAAAGVRSGSRWPAWW
jgi:transposase